MIMEIFVAAFQSCDNEKLCSRCFVQKKYIGVHKYFRKQGLFLYKNNNNIITFHFFDNDLNELYMHK